MSNELNIGGNSYGPNAVGRGARATQRNVVIAPADDDRLQASLATLRRLVDEHEAQIPEVARVRKDIDAVARETQDPDPDVPGLRDMFKRILARVAVVAVVAAATNDTREIVESLFS
ncbi:DUF5955 family protein [Micromonosporaceae bacterium Da 78-11]